jgi:hypothetical protein
LLAVMTRSLPLGATPHPDQASIRTVHKPGK